MENTKKDRLDKIEEKIGTTMLIFLFSIVVFMLNSCTGILVAWVGNYDWATMSFPAVGTRLLVGIWIVQGISWLSAATGIMSWIRMVRLEKEKAEIKEKG